MFKKICATLICAVTILTGCGQAQPVENANSISELPTDQDLDESKSSSKDPDKSESSTPDMDVNTDSNEESSIETDTREPETVSLIMSQTNGNEKVSITMTGLCQYDYLESNAYTDTPADGDVYLVMFLEIANHDNGDDYINPENMSATVDGEKVSQLGLFNQPESYTPIFDHINSGEQLTGYIAWEVPSDWQSFDMEYDGWQDTCALTVTAHVTPDMLTTPPSIE